MSDASPSAAASSGRPPQHRGLTWDHPRGRKALEAAARAAAADGGVEIEWRAHPLEGFESAPIAELAERYDLIVLDHPHLGEALASDSLVPLDEVFDAATLERIEGDAIGPSFASYSLGGSQWALPLDAATQVAAARVDLIPGEAPATWAEVVALSEHSPVALSLAGPHAFLTFASVLAGAGAPLNDSPELDSLFSSRDVAREVFELLATIARRAPAETRAENPIALLERMATTNSLAYVPLVYGYVNYSSASLQFRDAPRWGASARLGSTIGGTGIAISKRCPITPELVEHLTWLLAAETQRTFIPQHAGQPGLRSAWHDDAVNEAAQNFYSNTATTIEESWVRPRYDGYIAFQAKASELLRAALLGGANAAAGVATSAGSGPADSLISLDDTAERCLDALDAAFAVSTRIDATDAPIHSATPTTSGVSA